MMVRTSAKSTLIMPWVVMRSLMPCTAWSSTSSARSKASSIDMSSSPRQSSFWFGIVMIESTESSSSWMP